MQTDPVIGDIDARLKRFGAAKGRREQWESMWRKAYQYAIPNKEVFTDRAKGHQRNAQVYDETCVKSVPKFATRIQAALVPTWAQWAKLVPGGILPDDAEVTIPDGFESMFEDADEIDEVLEKYTEIIFHYIHHSNFNAQAFEAFQDLSISNGALLCESDPIDTIKFTSVPATDLYLDSDENTHWRELKVAGRNLPQRWPDADIPPSLRQEIDKAPDTEHCIIEGVIYDPDKGNYHLTVIHEKEKHDLYYENKGPSSPWIVFGWSRTPGERYSRGPVLDVLPAVLSLNKFKEHVLTNSAFKAGGTWTGVSDGVWNPYNIKVQPGTIIGVASNENTNPSLRPLETGGDLAWIDWLMQDLKSIIQEALFANPLGDVQETPVRTLGENMLRVQDMLEQAGASFSLLETEFVAKVLKRVTYLLVEAGKLFEIPEIDGEAVTIKMQSPIAQARNAQELDALALFAQSVMQFGPESVPIYVNLEEVYELSQKHSGLPAEVVNDEEKRQAMLEQMQQMAGQSE